MSWMKYITIGVLAAAAAVLPVKKTKAEEAEEIRTLSVEEFLRSDLSSDTRLDYNGDDLEITVEHFTDSDYDDHATAIGFSSPGFGGFRLRQTGILNYGGETDTNGGFETNIDYAIPDSDFRLTVGGGANFPDNDWLVHGVAGYFGDVLNMELGVFHHEEGDFPVDVRGYASMLTSGFYLSAGKCEGPNMFAMIGYIGGRGEFNLRSRNWVNFEERSSRHDMMFTWNSSRGRSSNEFQNWFMTNVRGSSDLLGEHYDPTIGFAPVLAAYGEYGLELKFHQNEENIGGGVSFAYNRDNRGNLVQISVNYNRDLDASGDGENPNLMSTSLIVGTNLNGWNAFLNLEVDSDREVSGWFYVGHTFDL